MPDLDEEAIFNTAKGLKDPSSVAAYLDSVCGSDPDLRRRIERLLALQSGAHDFFRFDALQGAGEPGTASNKPTVLTPTQGQDQNATVAWDPSLRRFGDYELLEEIARGGMGVVYKARQVSLERLVAVKTLLHGAFSGQDSVQRFRVEASAAASLRHPNIVAVHEVGVHGDEHYLVMDYIPGPTLSKLCAGQPLAPKRAAAYVRKIAEAVHFAHEHGVLHRDLKPSNVLIDQDDQPHVTDFGLAKRQDKDSELTLSGQVLGTPSFMAPEQASGKRGQVGRYTDVYSLGAILFHLLTGRPPFVAENLTDTLQMVLEQEPMTPRSLVMGVPRDLDTICLKCLRKEPGKRYSTARELAEELERFLNQEPIRARRTTRAEKLWRWCRRRPALASLGAATGTLTLAFLIGSPIALYRIDKARRAETDSRTRAEHSLYIAKMNLVQRDWEQNNVRRVRQLLSETATNLNRGFEWYYWQRQTHLELKTLTGHSAPVLCVAWSPDGQRVLTGSGDHTARIWDAVSGKELITLIGHRGEVLSAAYFPDGQRIITGSGDHTFRVWDAGTGKQILIISGNPKGDVASLAVSPDGTRIVTGSWVASVRDAVSGKELFTIKHPTGTVRAVAYSPDGRRIVTWGFDTTIRIWEATTGKELCTSTNVGQVIAFSPDGERVVACSYLGAKVCEAISGRELFSLTGHSGSVNSAAFSRDGQRIITGSVDDTAKVWDATTGKEIFTIKGHRTEVNAVAFSPDGRRTITGCGEGGEHEDTAKIWDATGTQETLKLEMHDGAVNAVVFSPDGRRIITGISRAPVRVWDSTSGNELALVGHSNVTCIAISRDGQRVVTGAEDHTAKVWDASNGKSILTLTGFDAEIRAVAFSSDGQRIAAGSADGEVKIFESVQGTLISRLNGDRITGNTLAFSADDRFIVAGFVDGQVRICDANSGKEIRAFQAHDAWIVSLAFSPDGQRFITGGGDYVAKVWDMLTSKQLLTLEGQAGQVWAVAYSPDGRRIVTGGEDGIIKVWEASSGEELLSFRGHAGPIRSITFSPEGTRLASGSDDGTAKIWPAATSQQVEEWDQEEKAAAERSARDDLALKAADEREAAARAQDPGAIKQWLVLAPIHFEETAQKAIAQEQVPNEAGLHPRAGEHIKIGTNDLDWSPERLQDYEVNFSARKRMRINNKEKESVVGYAVSYIQSDSDQTNLCALIGTSRCCDIFLNGSAIYEQHFWADYFRDADLVTGIALKHGLNTLLMKVASDDPAWFKASIRFTDPNGRPVTGIKVTLDPGKMD